MQKAMDIAKKSLEDLPETPVSAAGYNFKFKSNRHIPALAEAVDHRLDQTFSDSDYTVLTRAISRSLKWKNGEIRVIVSQEEDNAYSVLMNFHMGSDSTDTLKEWLSVPIADARKHIEKILFQCLGISEGMINHAEEPE
jgi:hypothetical protein